MTVGVLEGVGVGVGKDDVPEDDSIASFEPLGLRQTAVHMAASVEQARSRNVALWPVCDTSAIVPKDEIFPETRPATAWTMRLLPLFRYHAAVKRLPSAEAFIRAKNELPVVKVVAVLQVAELPEIVAEAV